MLGEMLIVRETGKHRICNPTEPVKEDSIHRLLHHRRSEAQISLSVRAMSVTGDPGSRVSERERKSKVLLIILMDLRAQFQSEIVMHLSPCSRVPTAIYSLIFMSLYSEPTKRWWSFPYFHLETVKWHGTLLQAHTK